MRKPTKPTQPIYVPPPEDEFWFYIGDKYYYRCQPIPYKKSDDSKQIQRVKQIISENPVLKIYFKK